MAEEDLTADAIKGLGWRQGSILPGELVVDLRAGGLLRIEPEAGELWVVLSHSCDVVNRSFVSEPSVELIRIAKLVSGTDGSLAWFRNPRICHFREPLGKAGTEWCVSIHSRVIIPRAKLLGHRPDMAKSLQPDSVRRLASWAARRYTRAAFPDEFNSRCLPAQKSLRQKLKTKGHLLTGIFLVVDDEELAADIAYNVIIVASMHEDMYHIATTRNEAQALLDAVETALDACDGIEVQESSLRSEEGISLGDLRLLKRWDLDYLSLRAESVEDLPPAQ